MPVVVSPQLSAVGAGWVDGPAAGGWIQGRLASFGPTLGHAVPLGYPAYAVVPIVAPEDPEEDDPSLAIVADVVAVLTAAAGDQPICCAIWEGFGWMYETGTDPRETKKATVGLWWDGEERPSPEEIDQARAAAIEEYVGFLVEAPDVAPLGLPYRDYYVWTGPPPSVSAFAHYPYSPPSLVWPTDRSWVVGAPIYTLEVAIAAAPGLIDAVLAQKRFAARPASPADILPDYD